MRTTWATPIFIRTKQGLKLTHEGQIFLDTAVKSSGWAGHEKPPGRRVLEKCPRLGDLRRLRPESPVPFTPGAAGFLPQLSKVSVEIVEARTKDLEEKLQKGTIDLGILIPPLSDSSNLRVFMDEEIVLAA